MNSESRVHSAEGSKKGGDWQRSSIGRSETGPGPSDSSVCVILYLRMQIAMHNVEQGLQKKKC